jgi:hypothetical protein
VTGLCSQSNVVCNPDYGTSLGRGSFSFATGQWQTIYLLTVLNEVGKANGLIESVLLVLVYPSCGLLPAALRCHQRSAIWQTAK